MKKNGAETLVTEGTTSEDVAIIDFCSLAFYFLEICDIYNVYI